MGINNFFRLSFGGVALALIITGFVVYWQSMQLRQDVKQLVTIEEPIEDAVFKTYGCGSAIASSSLVTTMVKGKSLDEALTIKNDKIAKELSLPPVKLHCSMLAEDAIKSAIKDYKTKNNLVEAETIK